MEVVLVYTTKGLGAQTIEHTAQALHASGVAVSGRHGVLSAFDLPTTLLSIKAQYGAGTLFLVLGVVQGAGGVDGGMAALNLMSTLSDTASRESMKVVPHITALDMSPESAQAWVEEALARVQSLAQARGAASPGRGAAVAVSPVYSPASGTAPGVSPAAAGVGSLKEPVDETPVDAAGFIQPTHFDPPQDHDTAAALQLFKESLALHGARGIVAIGRKFRIIDDDGSKAINWEEWNKALAEHQLTGTMSPQQVQALFDFFDKDGSGSISFDEFLVGIRGEMNERRTRLADMAFNVLDKDGSGTVELSDIIGVYDASKHPDVVQGRKSSSQVLREFLDTFDCGEKDGIVTRTEFRRYYSNISASIDDDDYFELVVRNAWHISGGKGWCANTSNRRVLVTHADGRQTVEEVTDDMQVGTDLHKIKAQMQRRGMDVTGVALYGGSSTGGTSAAPWATDSTADASRFTSPRRGMAPSMSTPSAAGRVQPSNITPGQPPFGTGSPGASYGQTSTAAAAAQAGVAPPPVPSGRVNARGTRALQSSIVFG